jgi:hypothetical protein
MMVQAYATERRFIESRGGSLGTPAVTLDKEPDDEGAGG